MAENKAHKIVSIYLILVAIEALLGAVYMLGTPSESRSSMFGGYSLSRQVMIGGFIIAFFVALLGGYWTAKNAPRLNQFVERLFERRRRTWLILVMLVAIFVMVGLACLIEPAAIRELGGYRYYRRLKLTALWLAFEPYYPRLLPALIWVVLVSAQSIVVILWLRGRQLLEDILDDLDCADSRLAKALVFLNLVGILLIGLSRCVPLLLVGDRSRAVAFARNPGMNLLHTVVWVLVIIISLLTALVLSKRLVGQNGDKVNRLSSWCCLLFIGTLSVTYFLLTVIVPGEMGNNHAPSEWNVFYVAPDSGGYISRYSPYATRPPIYPLFIQLTAGSGFDHRADAYPLNQPIRELNAPLMRVAQAQKVVLLVSSLVACFVLMRLMNTPLPVPFFLWLYDYGFLSQEVNHILSEPLAQTWLFLILAAFFAFLWKGWKPLLPLAGVLCALLYLTRPAGAYSGVLLVGLMVWAVFKDWRAYWRSCVLAVVLPAFVVAVPIFYSYFLTGLLVPTPMYSMARVALALQVARPEDVDAMPDEITRLFLEKALAAKKVEDAKLELQYPDESERVFEAIVRNIYPVAPAAAVEVLGGGSKAEIDALMLRASEAILRRHRLDYYRLGGNAFVYAVNRMSLTRLPGRINLWVVLLGCFLVALWLRGWVGLSSSALILTHLAHLAIVSLFDIPIYRYVWATEFLVLLAVFILFWGFVQHFYPSLRSGIGYT